MNATTPGAGVTTSPLVEQVRRQDATIRAVLDLHSPVSDHHGNQHCAHCVDAYGDPAEWPCFTVRTIRDEHAPNTGEVNLPEAAVAAARDALNVCICEPCPTGEGPERECPLHGDTDTQARVALTAAAPILSAQALLDAAGPARDLTHQERRDLTARLQAGMTDDGARVDRIEARANAATEGPWELSAWDSGHSKFEMAARVVTKGSGDLICDMDGLSRSMNEKDALDDGTADGDFIAHTREDIPWLVEQFRKRDAALHAILAMHRAEGIRLAGRAIPFCEQDASPYPCAEVSIIQEAML